MERQCADSDHNRSNAMDALLKGHIESEAVNSHAKSEIYLVLGDESDRMTRYGIFMPDLA